MYKNKYKYILDKTLSHSLHRASLYGAQLASCLTNRLAIRRDVKYTNTNTNVMTQPADALPSEIRDVRNTNNTEECFNTPDPRWKKNQFILFGITF